MGIRMADWYYKVGNIHAGPASPEELVELAKAGTIKPETELWHDGMNDWAKAAEIAELDLPFVEEQAEAVVTDSDPALAGPWARFWARVIDTYVVTLILAAALGWLSALYLPSFFLKLFGLNEVILNIIFLPIAGLVLALMMRITGTTIGKAIVGIKVQNISGANTFLFYLKREFRVWLFGLRAGIPLANLITLINQRQHFAKSGSAGYDKGVAIVTGKSSPERCAFAGVIAVSMLSFIWYLGALDKSATADARLTQEWTNPATGKATLFSKVWTFEDLKAEVGRTYYFAADQLLAEIIFGYEPMDEADIDPIVYGEALQEVISDDLLVNSEWKPVKVNGFNAARTTAVHKSAADTNVEITVAIVGRSAWRVLVFVRGRPLEKFHEGESAMQSLFSTVRDINIPTNMPCEEESCVSSLSFGIPRTAF